MYNYFILIPSSACPSPIATLVIFPGSHKSYMWIEFSGSLLHLFLDFSLVHNETTLTTVTILPI
jgi:hypothetical protein